MSRGELERVEVMGRGDGTGEEWKFEVRRCGGDAGVEQIWSAFDDKRLPLLKSEYDLIGGR